jgi:hypothetical protein
MTKHMTVSLLRGLRAAPSQVFGGVRLLPLLRDRARDDVRLFRRREDVHGVVALDGREIHKSNLVYCGFVPHSFVLSMGEKEIEAAHGTQFFPYAKGPEKGVFLDRKVFPRMAKKEAGGLRFLPQHLAFEGYLSHHFDGPDIAWPEYTKQAIKHGLSPRTEVVHGGRSIVGLEHALRVFEIHEHQVGVAVFVADALAEIFVVPHADDYRPLHASLIEDAYGEQIMQYSQHAFASELPFVMREATVTSLATLEASYAAARAELLATEAELFQQVARECKAMRMREHHGTALVRFMPALNTNEDNHIGEGLVYADGDVAYLKTFRLSVAQTKRAFVLQELAACDFHLERTAKRMGHTLSQLVQRIVAAGFSHLFKPDILAKAARDSLSSMETDLG